MSEGPAGHYKLEFFSFSFTLCWGRGRQVSFLPSFCVVQFIPLSLFNIGVFSWISPSLIFFHTAHPPYRHQSRAQFFNALQKPRGQGKSWPWYLFTSQAFYFASLWINVVFSNLCLKMLFNQKLLGRSPKK